MQYLLSKQLVEELQEKTRALSARAIDGGIDPQLGVVLIGDHEASLKFIDIKTKQAKASGIILSLYQVEAEASYPEVEAAIRFLADDDDIHGIVLQLPLPDRFTSVQVDALIDLIPPSKDVDGLRNDWQRLSYTDVTTAGLLSYGPAFLPPMVSSVCSLLDTYSIDIRNKKVVLVGEGRLVGAPLHVFLDIVGIENKVVTEETEGILAICQGADILISATGQNDLITYQWIQEGAVVIDCAADIHTDSVEQVASALAPSRGGVGPLTVAWLLYNLAQAANHIQEVSHE